MENHFKIVIGINNTFLCWYRFLSRIFSGFDNIQRVHKSGEQVRITSAQTIGVLQVIKAIWLDLHYLYSANDFLSNTSVKITVLLNQSHGFLKNRVAFGSTLNRNLFNVRVNIASSKKTRSGDRIHSGTTLQSMQLPSSIGKAIAIVNH